ncbi:MAG: tetratricopeptide repeat protein [Chloroflexi bacterium]|nr:tetratricopeptide repeat protein [Chloroflexota bacterium]
MPIKLSRTQIPTQRARILKRVRLLDLLHEHVHRRLIFVCAPAGYGKTTLLQSFIADVEMVVCWYQIGPEDDHLSLFLEYLIRVIENSYPRFRECFPEIGPAKPDLTPDAAAAQFINAVIECVDNYTLLVLDDYHLVSQQPAIVQFMESLLAALPEQLRLVVSSRSVYGIPTAHLFIHQEIAILAAEDLKFKSQEVRDLSRHSFHRALSQIEVDAITRTTDGWPLATMLVLQDEIATTQPLRLMSAQEQVFEYFRDELLGQLDAELVRFLTVTSLVDEFTLEQAGYLLNKSDIQGYVRQLFDRNLFIAQRDNQERDSYSYHQLFREFLLEQFTLLERGTQQRYHARAAEWFERTGATAAAIQHWFAAGAVEIAAELINRSAKWAYTSGRQDLLDEWHRRLASVPQTLHLAPDLLLNRAKSLINRGQHEEALPLLDVAEPVFVEKQDYENLCNLLVTRGMLQRFMGEYQVGLDLALKAKELAGKHDVSVYHALQAERLEGITNHYLGHIDLALERLSSSAAGLRTLLQGESGDRTVHELIAALTDIGYICITNGRIQQAESAYLEALQLSAQVHGNRGDQAVCGNNAAYLHYIKGDYARAWELYEQALQAARESGWRAFLVDVLNGQGDLLRDIGEQDRAAEKYAEAQAQAGSEPAGTSSMDTHLGLAELERLQANYAQAQWHVREAARLGKSSLETRPLRVQNAAIYLAMGHPELVLEILKPEHENTYETFQPDQKAAAAYFLLAIAQQRTDQAQDDIRASLKRALEITARLGYDAFFVGWLREFGAEVRPLEAGMNSPQLRSLLARADEPLVVESILGRPKQETAEVIPSRIEARGLGRAEVRVNGERLTASSWQSLGARSLFFYILEHQPVGKDQIALTFWPDFSPGKVNSNFHATLWRVRNALGNPQAIHFDEQGYALHPAHSLYYDVAEFEQAIQGLGGLDKGSAGWRNLAEQAINLYTGDFLPEIDVEWVLERARQLRQKFLVTLTDLADFQRAADRPSQALELFSRAAEIDPYEDQWRLGVLRSYVGLNQRQAARNYFQAYKQLLADELGVEPGGELTAFSRTLD